MISNGVKILAVIPARAGSKGIKNKNIRAFAGTPLIAHTIREARKSRRLDRIIVSTDSEKIARLARKYGAEVPFLRPKRLAGDRSDVADAVLHLLDKLKKDENYQPGYVLLLQPTSPLRTVKEIDESVELSQKTRADGVVSVKNTEQLVYTMDKNGFLKLIVDKSFLSSPNRQELPAAYVLDGAMIYLVKTSAFKKEKTFLPKRMVGYVNPGWKAVDLDEAGDFVLGEMIFRNVRSMAERIKNFK